MPSRLWLGSVFHDLQCTVGQDYYSVLVYSLCSFLTNVFVNKIYRYASPSVLMFVTPLTKLVSAFVHFSETTALVNIFNHSSLTSTTVSFHLLPFWFLSVCISTLVEVYDYLKKKKREEACCKCKPLMLFVTTARTAASKYRSFRVAA